MTERLTEQDQRELDAILGKLLLPTFTPREVEIASATARAVMEHVRAALAPVADSAAARWHVGQMALYRRLETLAKDDEWRGARRDDGLAAEMRFKADMHERAARALSRPSNDGDPVPAHHYRCDDAYGCDWHGSELVPDPDGVLRCPACSSVAIIEPPATSSPAFPARRASPTPEPGHSEPPAERRTAMSSNTPPPAGLSAAQIEFCAEDGEWGGPCCPFCSASPEGQHRDDCAWAKSAWTRERIAKGIAAALRALHAAPKPTAGLVEAVREWQRVNEHRRRPRSASSSASEQDAADAALLAFPLPAVAEEGPTP